MTVRDIVYIQLRRVHVKRFSVKNYVCLSFGCHQFRNTITFQGHAQQVNNKPWDSAPKRGGGMLATPRSTVSQMYDSFIQKRVLVDIHTYIKV